LLLLSIKSKTAFFLFLIVYIVWNLLSAVNSMLAVFNISLVSSAVTFSDLKSTGFHLPVISFGLEEE